MTKDYRALVLVLLLLLPLACLGGGPELEFIENRRQWDPWIEFGANVPGGAMFLNSGGFHYYLVDGERLQQLHEHSHEGMDEATGRPGLGSQIEGQYVSMQWSGARPSQPQPFGKHTAYYNYFIGNDPARYADGARSYQGVLYAGIYEGIDLKVYASGKNLKYDFIVAPGGDPSCIGGVYAGMNGIVNDGNGNINIRTSVGDLIENKPYAYQVISGKTIAVQCEFMLEGNRISFSFPDGYDSCETLVIDPLLIFSTYSGSTADNWGSTATPGENGTLYSAGVTNLAGFQGTFPVRPGVFQTSYGGWYDVGILKYDSTGQDLLYASYLGGVASDSPHSLIVDELTNDLLVLGTTSSSNFPVTAGALDTSFGGGAGTANVIEYFNGSDLFVSRISSDGRKLRASTFIGGAFNDGLNATFAGLTRNYGDELRGDIITDKKGNVYISSVTSSSDLALHGSYSTAYKGGTTDAILLKLSSNLDQQLWGAFIGGSGTDAAYTLKLSQDGDVLIAGGTMSSDFPVTAGSYQASHAGDADGWIARITGDGQSLLHATFTGTASYDQVYFLDINSEGEIYTYGQTAGSDFPVTPGVYSNPNSGQFIQKLSPDLSTLVFSTVFGSGRGIPDISPTAFLVNECNNLYMTGWGGVVNSATSHWQSDTFGMPLTPDAYQSTTSGSDFYFMVLTADASEFLYGTYLGGSSSRTHVDGGTSRFDKEGIVYHAVCSGCAAFNATSLPTSDFPTTQDAWSAVNRSQNCNNAAFKFDLASLRARLRPNSVALDMPDNRRVCLPDGIVFQNLSVGGEVFRWDLGDGTKVVKSDTARLVHYYSEPGRYPVKLVAIDPGTCKGKDSTTVFIDVYGRQSVVQDDDQLCEGDAYTLNASGGSLYHWTSEAGSFESLEPRPKVKPDTTTRYFVSVTESNGCVLQDTVDLTVVPSIEPLFDAVLTGNCTDRPALRVTNLTDGAGDAQMTFDFGDGSTSDLPDDIHEYEKDDLYQVKLTGVREFCVYESVLSVPVFSMTIPNVITPGATPGYNDKFTIRFGDAQSGLTPADLDVKVELVVYNRWGTKVYESSDYQYDWGGEGLPAGIYFYELVVGKHTLCKSFLEIMKD